MLIGKYFFLEKINTIFVIALNSAPPRVKTRPHPDEAYGPFFEPLVLNPFRPDPDRLF